jgi:hypothetical protein
MTEEAASTVALTAPVTEERARTTVTTVPVPRKRLRGPTGTRGVTANAASRPGMSCRDSAYAQQR